MPRDRIPMNISFPTEKEKQDAIDKADERDKSVSEMVQAWFRRLPRLGK